MLPLYSLFLALEDYPTPASGCQENLRQHKAHSSDIILKNGVVSRKYVDEVVTGCHSEHIRFAQCKLREASCILTPSCVRSLDLEALDRQDPSLELVLSEVERLRMTRGITQVISGTQH